MRFFLAIAALALLPSAASAECTCICNGAKVVPLCFPPSLTPPICQQICTPSLNAQRVDAPNLGFISGGSGGALPTDTELQAIISANNNPTGNAIPGLSGTLNAGSVSGTLNAGSVSGALNAPTVSGALNQ